MKEKIQKLHRQFAHPTSAKLLSLMKTAGFEDSGLEKTIKEVSESCTTCIKFKRPEPRPVVSMPLASKFNEMVSLDLKVYDGVYFLVMVDVATRFCSSCVITNKCPKTIIEGIFTSWISLFGTPNKFLSDNGGEFNNNQFRELGECFNIRILNTAAESPWSNGVCERLNAVIGQNVKKIMDDTDCGVKIALAWAISARNSLSNFSGFSPNQLVFGRNPNLPNVFENEPPALECDREETSDIVRKNINAMYAAREGFMKNENSERIKRALRHNIRSSDVMDLQNGDVVYYKRRDNDQWRGPETVIGRDGKQVLVRHGGVYVRVHICRLQKLSGEENVSQNECSGNSDVVLNDDSGNSESGTMEVLNLPSLDLEIYDDNHVDSNANDNQNDELLCEAAQHTNDIDNVKIGKRVEGLSNGEFISGKVVSRAGKVNGKYKYCYNIMKDDGSIDWYDIKNDFDEFKLLPDNEEVLVLQTSSDDKIFDAKRSEIQNWIDNDVFAEVENIGQEYINVRWVITEKTKNDQTFVKARLVARGFEEDTSLVDKDSPTCHKESIRLVLSIASSKKWLCHSLDVKAAYLQGNPIEREVYLKPPPEFFDGHLWKLKKTVYGLNDAARAWYVRVRDELLKLNLTMSLLDPALFSFKENGEFSGLLCVYVDDFLWTGTLSFEENIISKIINLFKIGSSENTSFKYIGLNLNQCNEGGLTLDQFHYGATLQPIGISRQRSLNKFAELSEKERDFFKAAIGQLNWMSTQTRPDISFDVCELSVSYKNANIGDLIKLNKIISRVKSFVYRLYFQPLDDIKQCFFECYTDASFGNLSDGGSQGGYIIFLSDYYGSRCPIIWQSKKIKRVVKSTIAAETLALLDGAETAVYLAELISQITGNEKLKVRCYVDNKSVVDSLHSLKRVENKRLRIDMSVLSNMLQRGEIESIEWIESNNQFADCLTKKGASCQHLLETIAYNL